MHIANIEDLQFFLSDWYRFENLGMESEIPSFGYAIPSPLSEAWTALGKLFVGYEHWLNEGERSPMASQDGFIAPNFSFSKNGFVHVVLENQGNWTMGFAENDKSNDPEMYSDFLEMPVGGTGFAKMGCKLSELIITSILTETIFFGSIGTDVEQKLVTECCEELWLGHYYNAIGHGSEYEAPSHQIRTNSSRSKLALFWDNEFSGFLASAQVGQQRLRTLLDY